ncbi:MAG: hypothetical protein U9Q22_04045 [Candidatus Altiarchaeota archaeon]|nr:hypothetical protein [Candidatus Altiarchaeota archaeon]
MEHLFAAPISLERDLEEGIQSDLQDIFRINRKTLSESAIIRKVDGGWEIVDDTKAYFIKRVNGKLNIYKLNLVENALTSCRHVLCDMLGLSPEIIDTEIPLDDLIHGRLMRIYAGLTVLDKLLTDVMDVEDTPIGELSNNLTDIEDLLSNLKGLTSPDDIEKTLPLFNVHYLNYLVEGEEEIKLCSNTLKEKFDEDYIDLVVDFIFRMYKTSGIKADMVFVNKKNTPTLSITGREKVSSPTSSVEVRWLQDKPKTKFLISGIGVEGCDIIHGISTLKQEDTPLVFIDESEDARNKIKDIEGSQFLHIDARDKKLDTLTDAFNLKNGQNPDTLLIIHSLDDVMNCRVSSNILKKLHKTKKETPLSTLSLVSGGGGVEGSYNTLFSIASLLNYADLILPVSKSRLTEISGHTAFTKGRTLDEKTHNIIAKAASLLIPVIVNLFMESKTRDEFFNKFIIPAYYELPRDSFERISRGALWKNLKLWIKETIGKYMFIQCDISSMNPLILVVSAPYTKKEVTEEELKKIGESLGEEYGVKRVIIHYIPGGDDTVRIGMLGVSTQIRPVIQELLAFNKQT